MNRFIKAAVQKCSVCLQRGNMSAGQAPFKHLFSQKRGQRIYIDLIGKLPKKSVEGYSYILNVVDAYSKHVTSIPLRTNQADNILEKLLTHYIYVFGYPQVIVSDNANVFVGSLMQDYCSKTNIKYVRVPAYHPQGNSVVERLNGSLKSYLYKLTHERGWSALDLASCAFAYNTSIHSSLKETPFFLVFQEEPVIEASILYNRNFDKENQTGNTTAIDLILRNNERMILAQNHLHATFERTDQLHPRKYRNNEYVVGSPVLVRNFRKIYKSDPKFIKGFVITEKINDYSYNVKNARTDNVTKYHISDLKNDLDDPFYLEREIERFKEGIDDREESEEKDESDNDENVNNDKNDDPNVNNDPNEPKDEQTDQPQLVPSGTRVLRPRRDLRAPDRLNL